jgi:dinuclear metal center YbgI/SA1388 family protein
VAHHPLFLRGTSSVAATTPAGRSVHRLISGGCGLLTLHTNADSADPGVSDALAAAVGLSETSPLQTVAEPLDKLVTFVPVADADRVIDALAAAGAGRIGDYDRAAFTVAGTGTFRPLAGADPHIGEVGRIEEVAETRLEMVLPRRLRRPVIAALREAHAYEEVAFDLIELAAVPGRTGLGRLGRLPRPEPLRDVAERLAAALPPTAVPIRVAGDPDRDITTIAVCGGAGDSLIAAAASAGADLFITADLRHHPTLDATAAGLALIDAGHYATEQLWLGLAAAQLRADLAATGSTVETHVSGICTDPWTFAVRSPR